jgi:hypothetical protein
VDEQAIPQEVRRMLDGSGFRCGVIEGPLPKTIREKLDQATAAKDTVGNAVALDESERVSQKKLLIQAGRRSKVVLGELREKMIVLLAAPTGLRGETFQQAQCLFSLKCYPQTDGRVRVELTPEIEHGAVRQRVIGQAQDGAFRLDAGKDRAIFDQLRIAPELSAGQTLVITATPETKGLGRQFFAEGASGSQEERVLLIRLAQSPADDLFQAAPSVDPLTTPLD